MMGGNDYKLTSTNSSITKSFIKKTILAYVKNDSILLNCVSFDIQPWYALCRIKGDNLVFKAAMTNGKATSIAVFGGGIGAGLSASNRYLYALNLNTGDLHRLNDQEDKELEESQLNSVETHTQQNYKEIEIVSPEETQSKVDSVLLNNENLITGQIIIYTPNIDLKILTAKGVFYFTFNDIRKIAIHSTDSIAKGFDISDQATQLSENFKVPNETKRRISSSTPDYLKYGDGFPVNLFIIQGGTDGFEFYSSPLVSDFQKKIQIIYSRRFWQNFALGAGYGKRFFNNSHQGTIIFSDIRFIDIQNNHYKSFACNLGIGDYYEAKFYLNLSYNYGFRIVRKLFLTIGIDYNFQKIAGIGDNKTFGITTGILF